MATSADESPSTEQILLVFVSAPADAAATLTQNLVAERLAACVQLGPALRSVYRWHGKVEQAEEVQLQIKTTRGNYSALQAHIRERHPYELPEILAVDVTAALPEYLQWIVDQTR
ncbi:MAG: divalent-cation tolerance protein CutA [Nevskia sp.]|nr:divalent-cation tolerance protein CutA [Nevskia sp.]